MQPNQDRIESLHQEAAARYLQGDFENALKSWQELLSIDAEDERALEGVRLCEMLAEEGDLLGVPSPVPIAASEEVPSIEQSAHVVAESSPVAMPVAPVAQASAGFLDLDDDDLGWDLSKLDLEGGEQPPVAVEPSAAQTAGLDSLGAALDAPTATLDSAAASELRVRIDDLMREATGAYEAGDRDTASRLLERVFILDDDHAAARNLQQTIRAESLPPEALADGAGAPLDLGFDLTDGDRAEEAVAVEIGVGSVVDAPPPLIDDLAADDRPDPSDIPMQGLGNDAVPEGVPEGVREAQREAAQADPGKPGGTVFLSPRFLGFYAVGLIVLLVAGWGALKFVGRSSDPTLDEAVRRMQSLDKSQIATNKDSGASAGDEATVTDVVATPDRLPAILTGARSAFDEGDYSRAIIGYNKVLEIDPDNATAKEWLELAGTRYREQRALQEKLDAAAAAWERGDYTEAMRIFYRLPVAEGDTRFERYKQYGWYNLGLQALSAGGCEDARSHFEELRGLAPDDPETIALLELARTCPYSANDPLYIETVEALQFRDLD